MRQVDGAATSRGRPLRVTSERLSDEEAERARSAPPVPRTPPPAALVDPAAARTTVLPTLTGVVPATGPAAPGLPVVAAYPRAGRRWSAIIKLVFGRRHAGRHRPETMTNRSWSMFAPQRRRARRWGRY